MSDHLTPEQLARIDATVARVHAEHPRILARADDFARLSETGKSSPRVGKWTAAVRATADEVLKAAPSKYEIPDGKRLLATSRRVLDRTLALGLTFRLTNDERYAERLWREIEAAANAVEDSGTEGVARRRR